MSLAERLLDRLKDATEHGLKYQVEYEETIAHLADTRLWKCVDYGERRYTTENVMFNRWMCYSDVYRKFIRLEHQMRNPQSVSREKLLETYSDLANYAIMAVQLIKRETNDEI